MNIQADPTVLKAALRKARAAQDRFLNSLDATDFDPTAPIYMSLPDTPRVVPEEDTEQPPPFDIPMPRDWNKGRVTARFDFT